MLARITLDGQATYTELKLPKCHEALLVSALANAGDGSVWIADHECQQLIRIAADGRQTVVAVPEMIPGTIAGDAAGGAWFVDLSGFGGHVDAAGQVSRVDPGNRVATGVAVAADGAAWFASGTCTLFRAAPDGTLTTEPAAVPAQTLAFDPAGGLWQASRTRLVHDSSSTPCDDTPPRIALSAHGHVSLAALRRGLTLTVEPGAFVRWTEAFDASRSAAGRAASAGSVHGAACVCVPPPCSSCDYGARSPPATGRGCASMVDAADRDGNQRYKNFSLLRHALARDDAARARRPLVEVVVVDDVREVLGGLELGLGHLAGGARSRRGRRCPRPIRRVRSTSCEGGAMKMRTASGIVCSTWRAPWTSISSTTDCPSAVRFSSSERSVP